MYPSGLLGKEIEIKCRVFLIRLFAAVFLLLPFSTTGFADGILAVQERFQEHSNWCWDASSQAVLEFSGTWVEQCDIADWAWSRDDCCGNNIFEWSHSCNQGNFPEEIKAVLSNWGIDSNVRNYPLSQATVISEIDAGRPFVMAFYWSSGGGHALVGRGIMGDMVYYMDPLPGNGYSIGTYSWVVANTNHTWGYTVQQKSGSISVISPQSDAIWLSGRSAYVTWEWEGDIGDEVKIELYKGGGLNSLISSATANDGTYRWTIPHDQVKGSDYRIRVSSIDGSNFDYSDYFTIEPWSEVSVIEISTVQQLQNVATGGAYPRDGNYKLMNDLDLGGINWDPLGSDYAYYFRGTFDGQGYTIWDLEIDRPAEEHIGLFSVLMDSGTIKNLNIREDGIHGYGYVGAFVGESAGTIINCHALIEDLEGKGGSEIGGLVGANMNTGVIRNCSVISVNDGDIEGDVDSTDEIGGIAGTNSGIIEWCWTDIITDADVSGSDGHEVGGIAGVNYGTIRECYSVSGWIDGEYNVGGIAGLNSSSGEIVNCFYSAGQVNADANAGGIVGDNDGGTVDRCYVTGSVDANSNEGRLAGESDSTISNSFYTGTPAVGSGGTVINCYSKSETEMKQESTFTSNGWDFNDVWQIDEGTNYPQLRGVGNILSSPGGLNASEGRTDGVSLTWNSVSGESVYRLYRADSEVGEKNEIADWQTNTTFLDSTAMPGLTYYYWVKAAATTKGARESDFSSYDTGSRGYPRLDAPTEITATDNMTDVVLVVWDSSINANYYRVYRSDSIEGTKNSISEYQTALFCHDKTVLPEIPYYYWVTASIDDLGNRESDFGGPDRGLAFEEINCQDHDSDGYYAESGCGTAIDCDDSDDSIYPGALEVCDGFDNDCDNITDEDENGDPLAQSCYTGPAGTENVGICVGGIQTCTGGDYGTCEGDVTPGVEVCDDALDNDCDDLIDCSDIDDCEAEACDDGLYCNGEDTCSEGSCEHSGTPCQPGYSCNETTDKCVQPPPPPPPPPPPDCETDEDCNDDNPCTDDFCDSGSCNNTQVDDGTECDDDFYCTADDSCIDGECVGTTRDCDDDLYCTGTESCNEDTDQCESSGDPCPEGTTCLEETDECRPELPCEITIDPETTEVLSGQILSFTINATGDCDDPDYEWSVKESTIGSSIDDQNGNYTAGTNDDFFNPSTDVVKVVDHANNDIFAEANIIVSWKCFLLNIYGENSEEVKILRSFRDNVLSKSPEGQELIKLYYEWSPAIVKAMEEDEEFKGEVKELIDGILGLVKRGVE